MALQRYDPSVLPGPFALMRRLSNDMDRMFRIADVPAPRFSPDIEVFERAGELVVRADLPGMTKDNIKVEVTEGELVISGERKEEKEEKKKGVYTSERTYGSFYRAVALPEGVKGDEAKATFKDGVLEVVMPAAKVVEKHATQLEIK